MEHPVLDPVPDGFAHANLYSRGSIENPTLLSAWLNLAAGFFFTDSSAGQVGRLQVLE